MACFVSKGYLLNTVIQNWYLKEFFFGGTRLMMAVLSDIPNQMFVFSVPGYKKNNKSDITCIPIATVKRIFVAFVGEIV